MDKNNYRLIRSNPGKPKLNPGRVQKLYDDYLYYLDFAGIDPSISEKNFEAILKITYGILGRKISEEEEFIFISDQVIKELVEDAKDGQKVNSRWFVDHIWYYSAALKGYIDVRRYNYLIPKAQDELYRRYRIEETKWEKIKRKVYTKYMSRN